MPLSFLNKLKVNEWEQMIDVNIKGILFGIAAVVPIMENNNMVISLMFRLLLDTVLV